MSIRGDHGDDPLRRIACLYERFARIEAVGRSPVYAGLASAVSRDRRVLAFLARLPAIKWQPNLLFATVRFLYGSVAEPDAFVDLVLARQEPIAEVMLARSTQTNEPGRCATLLPVLARLPQPIALLEVGASAGLCLLPDWYSYEYGAQLVPAAFRAATVPPTFRCNVSPGTPVPRHNVEVAWRAGIDLDPVDLGDPADVAWLEALVWPGQEHRLAGLRAGIQAARHAQPRVYEGDMRVDLSAIAQRAPSGATLVVFHSAVLAYALDPVERAAFATAVTELGAVWIANERPAYIPSVAHSELEPPNRQAFLLCIDGRPVAWTDPYGGAIWWLGDS